MPDFFKKEVLKSNRNGVATETAFFFNSVSDMQLFSEEVIDNVNVGNAGYY